MYFYLHQNKRKEKVKYKKKKKKTYRKICEMFANVFLYTLLATKRLK